MRKNTIDIFFFILNSYRNLNTFYKKGIVINIPFFGAKLSPNEMFRDDLWWAVPPPEIDISPIVEVRPTNPMVLKAEKVFQDALKK